MFATKTTVVERTRGRDHLAVVIEHLDGERKPGGLNDLFAFCRTVGVCTERGGELAALEAIRQAMLQGIKAERERLDWLEAQYLALAMPDNALQILALQGTFDSDLDADEVDHE